MPTNELLPFATAGGANVLSQAAYAAEAARLSGVIAGLGRSALANKSWRQSAFAAAMIGQFTADGSGQDTLDDGIIATFQANFEAAIRAQGVTAYEGFFISAPTVKTVYGVGADFADLATAFLWLSSRRILLSGSVDLQLPAGNHQLPASLQNFSHPDGQRISITGAALTGGGAPANSDFVITGNSAPARATDTGNHLTMLLARFPTRLTSAGAGSGLALRRIGLISNILFQGVGGVAVPSLQVDEVGSVSNVAIQGSPGTGVAVYGRLTLTGNLYLSGCGSHNMSGAGSQISGSNLLTYSSTLSGYNLSQNTSMAVGVVSARGNGQSGMILQEGATFGGQAGSIWQSNGTNNMDIDGGSYAHLRSSTIDGGGITPYGIRAVVGSFVQADSCTFGNHTTGPAYAFDSSNIAGKTCTGLGAGSSPTVNGGVGNSGSYITNV